jgi:hypothetical protein
MHGYLDKSEETHGTLVLASSSRLGKEGTDIGLRPLVDVFPTLCDLLALPQPGGHEGRSILDRPRVVRAPPAAPTTTPTRTTVAAVPAPAVPRRTR